MYGKEIKNNRKIANLTQQEVSKITGIPQPTISWIENNEGIPNIQQCVLLANCFGITLDELISRNTPTEQERIKKKLAKKQTININQTYNF